MFEMIKDVRSKNIFKLLVSYYNDIIIIIIISLLL